MSVTLGISVTHLLCPVFTKLRVTLFGRYSIRHTFVSVSNLYLLHLFVVSIRKAKLD